MTINMARRGPSFATGRGLVLMLVAVFLTPIPDALAKILGGDYRLPVSEIALARFIIQTLTILPILLMLGGPKALQIQKIWLNLLRGVLLAVATIAFFASLKHMTLADAVAIFFIQPLFVTLFSILLLKEAVEPRRITAVLIGFTGALLVIRPNFIALGVIATLPMICALLVAIYFILGRYLSETSHSLTIHFYTGLGAIVPLALFVLLDRKDGAGAIYLLSAGSSIWGLVIIMSLLASLVHLMYIMAFRLAPASLLAPLSYFEIISAAALGLMLFGDFPDMLNLFGMAIIILSGLFLAWADRAAAQVGADTSGGC